MTAVPPGCRALCVHIPLGLLTSLAFCGCPEASTLPDDGGSDVPVLDARPDIGPDVPGATCADPDRDGDGADSMACGGLDCDDDDPQRAPGRAEFCDPGDRDEDCDATTFGIRDLDVDDDPDDRCCNVSATGTRTCGTDCDDMRPGVSSTATEVCNAIDDDCDDGVDEMVTVPLWPDADADGYGDSSSTATSTPGCAGTAGFATLRGDCDEAASGVHVGASEVCNGIDDDCDTLVDDIVDGTVFCAAGSPPAACTTACGNLPGTRRCGADCRSYETCSASEACNDCDDDLDGSFDETFACRLGVLERCTTACGTDGNRTCEAGCAYGTCRAPEVCNFCDDDSMNGIGDENALATANDAARPLVGDGSVTPAITERFVGVASSVIEPPTGTPFDLYAQLLDGATNDQAGAYWIDLNRYQGWGPTIIVAEMRVRMLEAGGYPMGGWSVLVANGGTGDLGTPQNNGAPNTRTGMHFDWTWGRPSPTPGPGMGMPTNGDTAGYGRMIGTSTVWSGSRFWELQQHSVSVNQFPDLFGPDPMVRVNQRVTIFYQPENVYTPLREELVRVTFEGAGSYDYRPDTDPDTVQDPNDDFPVGSRISIGFTAGSYPFTFNPGGGPVTVSARVEARLLLRHFVPPAGPGPPTWTDYATIARSGLCPGAF